MSSPDDPPASPGKPPAGPAPGRPHKPSHGPAGTPRSGRRETARRHQDQRTTAQRLRTPVLAIVVIAVLASVSAVVLSSAAEPAYACTAVDTVQPAAAGEIGQVQPDMGAAHVQAGDKVTYPICPPASGKHLNKQGFGPLAPRVYGPDDASEPTGWVHNLEHGGLVLLYSCEKGACDDASIAQLQAFTGAFPDSPVCGLAAGVVGPVTARFEQMPTRYAALVWDRVLYLDTLDSEQVYEFFTRYGERVTDDGTWITPPEPQCPAPSPVPSAEPSPAAS